MRINNVEDKERDPKPGSVIITEAEDKVGTGEGQYHARTNNCEHSANETRYRKAFFFFFLFMSDAHHGINSSTQKYQSTQSNVALTSCRQDSGSPPF